MIYLKNTCFVETVKNKRFKSALEGELDNSAVEAIAEKLNLPVESVEYLLVLISIDIALLPEKVISSVGPKALPTNILSLTTERKFQEKSRFNSYIYKIIWNGSKLMANRPKTA